MGRMNGMELAQSVRSQYPAVPILFISGLPVPTSELEKVAPGTILLPKPFGGATLVEAVKKLISDQSWTALERDLSEALTARMPIVPHETITGVDCCGCIIAVVDGDVSQCGRENVFA